GFDLARCAANLLAKDGRADPFTLALYQSMRLPVTITAISLLALAVMMLVWRSASQRIVAAFVAALGCAWGLFRRDLDQFAGSLRNIRVSHSELILLGGIILLAVCARVIFIMQPFKHDEAYTVAVFANQPLKAALSDYHLPNNHLFHTFLVHIAYSWWGYAQWAVRLPAMLSGVLTVPALYLMSRTLHGQTTALIAATAAAAMPVMVDFATQSRGYTLVMLFSLLLFTLGIYIRQHPNLAAWSLVVIVTVLGIYTIPIFYFSYASFLLWIGLACLAGDINITAYGSRWKFIGWGFISGILTVILTALLYTPPALRSGLGAVLPYQVSDPLSYSLFFQEAEVRLTEFVGLILMELPSFVGWLLAIGFVLSLVLPQQPETICRQMRGRIPLQIAVVVGTFGLVFVLRAPPWARFLTFLAPLGLMWAAAGWVGLLRRIQQRLAFRWQLEHVLAGLALAGALLGTLVRFQNNSHAGFDVIGEEEQVTRFLQSEIREQDFIVVAHPQDAAVWYYWRLYGLDPIFFRDDRSIDRIFVLVDPAHQQTLDSVLSERGPDRAIVNLDATEPVFQLDSMALFKIPVR
ncbi:MAG TPA: glycosyltransferase family 39 protein, partial [Levilinea sp.]|nr:glycosyltransferase family 39 protein [Levilinea sp.]